MTNNSGSLELENLAAHLQLLLLDVDGVLTDGGIILIGESEEAKRFDAQDGMGITLARAAGIKVGIITSRSSKVVERRAKELHIDELFQGAGRKTAALDQIIGRYSIDASQVAFIGDDIQDVPVMKRVGVPIAVQNAVQTVKESSVYVTEALGGHGAVREAVDWLLDLRHAKEAAHEKVVG